MKTVHFITLALLACGPGALAQSQPAELNLSELQARRAQAQVERKKKIDEAREVETAAEADTRLVVEEPQTLTSEVDPDNPEAEPLETSEQLDIVCAGAGSANKAAVGSVSGWNSFGGSYSGTIVGQRSQGFADQVRVRLNDNDPRIRMPRSMLPIIRGGKNGWFKLKNIKYKDGEITASIGVSTFNNPKLRLDRYTGAISISGKAGDYTGGCQKFIPEETRRAF